MQQNPSQPPKQYPKNQPAFQPTSKATQSKNITNVSGTSLAQLTYTSSPKSSKNSITEIGILMERVQYLQKQLGIVTQLLMEQQSRKIIVDKIQRQKADVQVNLEKLEEINAMLQKQLGKSQKNNQELVNALKAVSEELQALKSKQKQRQKDKVKQTEKDENNTSRKLNDSKTSKTKQQIQQDIIKLNQQISFMLQKIHSLTQGQQQLKSTNQSLQTQNNALTTRISQLQQKLSQTLKQAQQLSSNLQYSKQQISLLKSEIDQVNQLSIKKQKQMQDRFLQKQRAMEAEIHQVNKKMDDLLKESISFSVKQHTQAQVGNNNNNKRKDTYTQSQDVNTLVQIKNVKIRALQIDNQILKQQLLSRQQQLKHLQSSNQNIQSQLSQSHNKIYQLQRQYKAQLRQAQLNYQNSIQELQQSINSMQQNQYRESSNLESQNYQLISTNRRLEQRILDLQSQIRENSRKQYQIQQLHSQIILLKQRQSQKDIQIQQITSHKLKLTQQLQQVRHKFDQFSNDIGTLRETKNKYQNQIASMKNKIRELTNLAENQQRRIREVQSQQQENSRKKIQDISIIETTQTHHKLDQLQTTNKQLQKMLINQKVSKQSQNKRYRQLLQDYKRLNEQLTTELQLYRDASNPQHQHCPILPNGINIAFKNPLRDSGSNSRDKEKSVGSRRSEQSDLRKQLEKQRGRFRSLMDKHQRALQRCKEVQIKISGLEKQVKQSQFLKIDNSSMRAHISQLSIRIEQYKTTIQNMKRQADNRGVDAEKIRYAMQREYQGKLELTRMEIINQYNVLLRNRGARIQPTEYGRQLNQQNSSSTLNQSPPSSPSYTFQYQTQSHLQPNNAQYSHLYSPTHPSSNPSPQPLYPSYSPSYSPSPSSHIPQIPSTSLDTKIRYHPDYKHLQQQYMKLHRAFLQGEQAFNKAITQHRDQIQKLKIQNQYHRKTIDQMHAQGYGLNNQSGSEGASRSNSNSRVDYGRDKQRQVEYYKNKYEEINNNYHRLYEQYVNLKSRNGHEYSSSSSNGQRIRQLLKPYAQTSLSDNKKYQPQKSELQILKKIIDDKLIQLEITPREPSSIIDRAGWVIQKLSALVLQLRQDRQTLRNQKKQVNKQNDKLMVKLETLQYQKNHIMHELKVTIEKFNILQQKSIKLGSAPHKSFIQLEHIRTSSINSVQNNHQHHNHYNNNHQNNMNKNEKINHDNPIKNNVNGDKEKDVYLNQASLIRQQRLALLKKFQKDISNMNQQGY